MISGGDVMGMGSKAFFLVGGLTLAFVSCTGALLNTATEEAKPGQGKDQQFFGEFTKRTIRNLREVGEVGTKEVTEIGRDLYKDSGFSRESSHDCTETYSCFDEEPSIYAPSER